MPGNIENLNVVLIGMPGCGKTTIGRLAAQKLNRPFFDIDEMITKRCGCDIPTLFRENGEKYFRDMESEAVKSVSGVKGAVIATGGGTVLRQENMRLLSQNGWIVLLRRPLEMLSTQGRPLSQKHTAQELWLVRKPFYCAFADAEADNGRTPEECVNDLLKMRIQG